MGQFIFLSFSFAPDFQECCWTPLKVSGNFWCSKIWKNHFLCCRHRLPPMHPSCEKFQLPFIQQPALPASSMANSAMQLQVINAKLFGIRKLKVWGQHKINWIAKWKSTGNSPDRIIQLHIYLIKARHFLIKTQPLQNFLVAAYQVGGEASGWVHCSGHRRGARGTWTGGCPPPSLAMLRDSRGTPRPCPEGLGTRTPFQGSALPSNAAPW